MFGIKEKTDTIEFFKALGEKLDALVAQQKGALTQLRETLKALEGDLGARLNDFLLDGETAESRSAVNTTKNKIAETIEQIKILESSITDAERRSREAGLAFHRKTVAGLTDELRRELESLHDHVEEKLRPRLERVRNLISSRNGALQSFSKFQSVRRVPAEVQPSPPPVRVDTVGNLIVDVEAESFQQWILEMQRFEPRIRDVIGR